MESSFFVRIFKNKPGSIRRRNDAEHGANPKYPINTSWVLGIDPFLQKTFGRNSKYTIEIFKESNSTIEYHAGVDRRVFRNDGQQPGRYSDCADRFISCTHGESSIDHWY